MLKFLFINACLFLAFNQSLSQSIEFGDDPEKVLKFIKYSTKRHLQSSCVSNYDIVYKDGAVFDILHCFPSKYLIDFHDIINYCNHYIFKDNQLNKITTQYIELSIQDVVKVYDNKLNKIKIKNFYFSDDYKIVSKIFIAENGFVCVEKSESNSIILPGYVKKEIKIQKQIIAEQNRKEREGNPTSNFKSVQELDYEKLFWKYIKNSDIDNLKELLNKGIDINQVNKKGESALHWAVVLNDFDLVIFLLDNNANQNIQNLDGKKPIDFCKDQKISDLVNKH